jgi:hypothetical protein
MSDDAKLAKARESRIKSHEERGRAAMALVYRRAAECLAGLYEPPTIAGPDGQPVPNPKYNPDAHATWAESSMKTRAALVIAKAQAENPDADIKAVFGVIIMKARATSAKDWEADAKKVEEEQRRKAIDVLAEPKAATG